MKHFILTSLAIVFSLACFATVPVFVPSTGSLCAGTTLYLVDSTAPGGTWSSSSTTIATIDSSGNMTGISAGVTTITYTLGSSYVTGTFTVVPSPGPIGGTSSFCIGTSVTLTDATAGGSWSSTDPTIATVNAATGEVTGVGGGVASIYYSMGSGCSVGQGVFVNTTPVGWIYGPTNVCVGSTIDLVDSIAADSAGVSGVWSSSNSGIATAGGTSGTCVVTGVAAGTVTITLTTTGICGINYTTYTITVGPVSLGGIYGPTIVSVGNTISCGISGSVPGTWSINPVTVATVDPATGIVTGISPGNAILTYTGTSCSAVLTATVDITVTALDGISGNVIFTSPYYGDVIVWLITYNPGTHILAAVDSTIVTCSGTSVYYQFQYLSTDSFRVKAAVPDSAGVVVTGPIPTYHDTSYYWDSASVIMHDTLTSDINENINMLYGSATGGPGFIGGNVYTGANRSTAGGSGIPVVGLNIIAINTTTNTIAGMTTTNSMGSYSFTGLAYGNYTIFPDSLNYATQSFQNIMISASTLSFTGAGFIQHTVSNTITPITEGVNNVTVSSSTVAAFPNPTSGRLNIQWDEKATEKATISIADITGREVYNTTVNMTQGSGMTAIDLSAFTNGAYMISIKSASLNYNSKIEVMH